MAKKLTEREIRDYHRDGFLFPRRVLSPEDAGACASRFDDYLARFGDDARGRGPMTKRPHLVLRWIAELVRHPTIVDAVEDLIGSDILCWSSAFFAKNAGDDAFVSWHQDANYWGLSGSQVVSAWIAFTPVTSENGCMRFIPGSHEVTLPHIDVADRRNLLSRGQTIAAEIDETEAGEVPLEAGEFALFHVNMAHASAPNVSPGPRIGFVVRYVASDIYQTASDFDSASLIRGRDIAGRFELEPMPAADLDPAAMAYHARVCGARQEVYFR